MFVKPQGLFNNIVFYHSMKPQNSDFSAYIYIYFIKFILIISLPENVIGSLIFRI